MGGERLRAPSAQRTAPSAAGGSPCLVEQKGDIHHGSQSTRPMIHMSYWKRTLESVILRPMITQSYRLYVESTDRAGKMARFNSMEIGNTLFGEACLIRPWQRIGTRGQAMARHFQREEGAVRLSSILRGERAAADIGHARLRQDKHGIIAAQFALM
ncbi:WGR domain-containing protein [Sinorhizobium fredii]|uniref:WGR domain-containing protein n=1 Tax=Rhizobium fredii TaxID=380 RepID=UPI00307CF3D2